MDSLTDSGLQSGFVLAVIIGAVLLAGYLGGTEGLAQKAAQVALGLALMLLVFSGTTAFHGLPAIPAEGLEAAFDFDSDAQFLERAAESSQRSSEIGTIHIGLGILFVALGVVLARKLSVLTPAFLLGGILLILFGAPSGSEGALGQIESLLGLLGPVLGTVGDTGDAREIARFVVLLVGVLLLTGLLYSRRERVASDDGAEAPATEEPGTGGDPE